MHPITHLHARSMQGLQEAVNWLHFGRIWSWQDPGWGQAQQLLPCRWCAVQMTGYWGCK